MQNSTDPSGPKGQVQLSKEAINELTRIATAVEQAAEIVIITDIEGTIEFVNPAFERITGYSRKEAIGQNPRILQSGKHSPAFYKQIWDCLTAGKVWRGRIINKKKDGSFYEEEATISPNKDDTGALTNYVAVKRDVTHETLLQQQLIQAQKLESIGTLAGGIAHDFNNILSSIIGYTELSLDVVEKNSTLEDNLQEIYTAGKRAKDLVKQILTFARETKTEMTPVQVASIAREALKLIRSSLPSTIEINTDIRSDSLILGDPTQVHQIFMNLCTNAAQAMEEKGGLLEVKITEVTIEDDISPEAAGLTPGGYLKIEISDTGAGMPQNILGLIFQPYFTTKSKSEGTGMGLSTVHGIVKSYGGEIQVSSEDGKGTRFSIFLPVTSKSNLEKPYRSEALPTGDEHILFVDDEAVIGKMSVQVLKGLGYKVTSRTSSLEALSLFEARPNDFDMVITDMTMPNMTGDELAIRLMAIKPNLPVILCTGYSKRVSDSRANQIGIKAFAYKPIIKSDLARTVRKVLDEVKTAS